MGTKTESGQTVRDEGNRHVHGRFSRNECMKLFEPLASNQVPLCLGEISATAGAGYFSGFTYGNLCSFPEEIRATDLGTSCLKNFSHDVRSLPSASLQHSYRLEDFSMRAGWISATHGWVLSEVPESQALTEIRDTRFQHPFDLEKLIAKREN